MKTRLGTIIAVVTALTMVWLVVTPALAHTPSSTVNWRQALIWGDNDTYDIDKDGNQHNLGTGEVSTVGTSTSSGGKILASASFEGFGTGSWSYGNDGDATPELDEYDNKKLLAQGVAWLIGPPDATNPQKILFTGWSSGYHSNTISYLQGLGYSVTWGGAFPTLTLTQLQSYDLLLTSCQGLGPNAAGSNPATEDAVVDYIDGGGKVWFLGHYAGPQPVTNLPGCHLSCSRISEDNVLHHFGIDLVENTVFDPTDYNGYPVNPVYHNFATHPVTNGLNKVSFDAGSSIVFLAVPVDKVFLTPTRLNVKRAAEHSFKIHVYPSEPLNVRVGDTAEVTVNGVTSQAVVSSTDVDGQATDIAIKVNVVNLQDNDPTVAIYSIGGTSIVYPDGSPIDDLVLDTFTK